MDHISYTANKINEIVEGTLVEGTETNLNISEILIDSRKLVNSERTVFFALNGKAKSGSQYIGDLIKAGVKCFVVDNQTELQAYANVNFIKVANPLYALQKLTQFHREQFEFPRIGITGSNGKTVVKEWLYQILREEYEIVRSPKSYNSQIGVPLSVWQIQHNDNLGIFEAGISEKGEMNRLEKIIHPHIGIITNIGEAHSENFSSLSEKVSEKIKLFSRCKQIIYCRDYTEIHKQIQENSEFNNTEKIFWSKKSNANLMISKIEKRATDTLIKGIYKNNFIDIVIPFIDDASIENAIHCWLTCLCLNLSNEFIAGRLAYLSPIAMRLELKQGIQNCSIINDSYNSDFGSLIIALDFLQQQKQHEKKTLILSDILQSGKNEEALYRQIAEQISKRNISKIIGIGEAISRQAHLFEITKAFYSSTDEFLKGIKLGSFANETILLKGARNFGFEKISKALQQKAHETVLEINLNALINNLNYYRNHLQPETKIMVMVKAFSYGSGSFEIANMLQFNNVDYLAVAYADEGVELRRTGINLPIMVMNPELQSFEAIINYNLEPEIYSLGMLQKFIDTLEQHPPKNPIGIHIELDTGMKRLGFEHKDLNELVVRIRNNRNLKIQSVFSHFVGSDEHGLDYFSQKQIKDFEVMSLELQGHFSYPILRHICNSSGITRFKNAHFDMVRLGIGLYGISSSESEQKYLQNVGTLRTTISQIKNIHPQESVGYSRRFISDKEMTIATIPIGYADGLNRRLGNGVGHVFIKNQKAPIVGNVCMDMCMVDVSNLNANEGDEVIVFNDTNSILELSKQLNTIPYELLTSVSQRVKRVYYHE